MKFFYLTLLFCFSPIVQVNATTPKSVTCTRTEYREEYIPGTKSNPGYVKSYLSFKEIPFENLQEDWYILGRVNETVNELRMLAKDAGLYYKANRENKCFDEKQWEAIKAWTAITKDKKIDKKSKTLKISY